MITNTHDTAYTHTSGYIKNLNGGELMINIDPRSSQPIYEQICDRVKENIVKGIMMPGDQLPSIRQLSSMILVNPNTISKAYQELERMGVIETIRGRGTFIRVDYKTKVDDEKMDEIKNALKRIIVEMHYMGLSKEDMANELEIIYQELEGE